MRARLVLALLALTAVGACFFRFDNPAEQLAPGEVRGRTVVEREGAPGTFDAVGAVRVRVRGTPYSVSSKQSGFFTLLDLPTGRVQLVFTLPGALPRTLVREVAIEPGSSQQVDAVHLGEVRVLYTAAVEGVAVDPDGAPIPFANVVDDVTSHAVAADSRGHFAFPALAVGRHRLRGYATLSRDGGPGLAVAGGPVEVLVTPEAQRGRLDVGQLPLSAADCCGRVTLSVGFVSASPAPDPTTMKVELVPPTGPALLLTPDSRGDVDDGTVPAGVYTLKVSDPDPGSAFEDTELPNVVVVKDRATELDTVLLVNLQSVQRAQNACALDDDCPSPQTCVSLQCSGTPPPDTDQSPLVSTFSVQADGGTIATDSGVVLSFLPGSVATRTVLTVTATRQLPFVGHAITPRFELAPAGTVFAHPVVIGVPLPPGATRASLYWTRQVAGGTVTDDLSGTVDGGMLWSQLLHGGEGYGGTPEPTRTVSGSRVVTYPSVRSTVTNVPADLSGTRISAVIPGDAGSIELLGAGYADGTFAIPNVPYGEYQLRVGQTLYFTTDRTALDLSEVSDGRPDASTATPGTVLDLTLTNLQPWTPGDLLELLVPDVNMYFFELSAETPPDAGATQFRYPFDITDGRWAHQEEFHIESRDVAVAGQLVTTVSDAGVTYLQMQRLAQLPAFATRPDASVSVSARLEVLSATSLASFELRGSEFEAFVRRPDGGSLVGPTPLLAPLMNQPRPFVLVHGVAGSTAFGLNRATIDLALVEREWGDSGVVTGGLNYALPMEQAWGVYAESRFHLRHRYQLPCEVDMASCPDGVAEPGAHSNAGMVVSDTVAGFSAGPIGPGVSPPLNPSVNDAGFFTRQRGVGLTPVIAWSRPQVGPPTRYRLAVHRLYNELDGATGLQTTRRRLVAEFVTPHERVQLPPGILSADAGYFFHLEAMREGDPNAGQTPFTTKLPFAGASVTSDIMRP